MKLTAKQEKFSQSIADGMNQSDAYRAAYDAERMKDSTINSKAYELMLNGEVSGRVKELKSELANKSMWTREQSVAVLAGVVDADDAKHTDRISAVKELNLMQGFQAPTKMEVSGRFVVNVTFPG